MTDPQGFWESLSDGRVVLDEIHRLPNPSELLKIASDHFPRLRVLATGSSALGASTRFRDSLTGRKRDIRLTPMTLADLADFGRRDLRHRLLRGGLPPFFLAPGLPERDFQEWMDAYWAKDIQELFHLERRAAFQRLAELVLARSGGIFEASGFARPCDEVDFVLARRGRPPVAIECEWSAAEASCGNLRAFRSRYPEGENIVVAQDADRSVTRSFGGVRVTVESLLALIRRLFPKR